MQTHVDDDEIEWQDGLANEIGPGVRLLNEFQSEGYVSGNSASIGKYAITIVLGNCPVIFVHETIAIIVDAIEVILVDQAVTIIIDVSFIRFIGTQR